MPRNSLRNRGFQKVIVEESKEDDITDNLPEIKRVKPSPAVFAGNSLSTKSILGQLVEFCGKKLYEMGSSLCSSPNSSVVDPLEMVPKKSTSLKKCIVNTIIVKELYDSLRQRGSEEYTREQKILACRAVYKIVHEDFFPGVEFDGEQSSIDSDDIIDDFAQTPNSPQRNVSLYSAVSSVSNFLGIGRRLLSKWVYEYHHTRDIAVVSRKNSGDVVQIDSRSTCNHFCQMELLEFYYYKKLRGELVTYPILQRHLESSKRYSEMLIANPDACPPTRLHIKVISDVIKRIGALQWGKTNPKGAMGKGDNEKKAMKQVARMWAIRLWIVGYHRAMIDEREGKVFVLCQDESFINLLHRSQMSLCENDHDGNRNAEAFAAPGLGPRLCMQDLVHRLPFANGHFVCKDEAGDWVRDCEYQNKDGLKVYKSGHFMELNNLYPATPRTVCLKNKADQDNPQDKHMSKMSKPELIIEAAKREINIEEVHFKDDILDLLLMSRSEKEIYDERKIKQIVEVPDPITQSLKQSCLTDFQALTDTYTDCSPTSQKFFEASKSDGDYHANYDTHMHFKNMVILTNMWPLFCAQVQIEIDAGRITGWLPFYDWEKKRPVRQLWIMKDRAPYHLGVWVQMQSCSKDEISLILRAKGIGQIKIVSNSTDANGNVTETSVNYQVPAEGYSWEHGNPSRKKSLSLQSPFRNPCTWHNLNYKPTL
jgi:hypothetical protein